MNASEQHLYGECLVAMFLMFWISALFSYVVVSVDIGQKFSYPAGFAEKTFTIVTSCSHHKDGVEVIYINVRTFHMT